MTSCAVFQSIEAEKSMRVWWVQTRSREIFRPRLREIAIAKKEYDRNYSRQPSR